MIDLLILLAVAPAVSAVGWKYFVYFFSLGYGYGIAALAVTMGILYHASLSVPAVAMLVLLFIFGIRLGTYLLLRERKAVGYRKILYGEGHSEKKPAGVMIMIWLFCALLYVAQVSPVAFRLANAPHDNGLWAWIGAGVVLCGILLESISDAQKAAAKKRNPKRFVDWLVPQVTLL